MTHTISLSDDTLNTRDIESRIDYLMIGNDFLEGVGSDTLRKYLNGDIGIGEGDKSALESAKDEISNTDDLDTLEAMADNLGYWSEVLSELNLEDEDPEEFEESQLAMIRGKICGLLDSESEAREFCDEFEVDYERWFDAQNDDGDELEELANWLDLKEQAEGYCSWHSGETLINDDYFVQYVKEGEFITLDDNVKMYFDWESYADDLRADLTEVEADGNTFLVRS